YCRNYVQQRIPASWLCRNGLREDLDRVSKSLSRLGDDVVVDEERPREVEATDQVVSPCDLLPCAHPAGRSEPCHQSRLFQRLLKVRGGLDRGGVAEGNPNLAKRI